MMYVIEHTVNERRTNSSSGKLYAKQLPDIFFFMIAVYNVYKTSRGFLDEI